MDRRPVQPGTDHPVRVAYLWQTHGLQRCGFADSDGLAFRVDIITRSRAVLQKRKQLGDWFLIDVTEKGKVLI